LAHALPRFYFFDNRILKGLFMPTPPIASVPAPSFNISSDPHGAGLRVAPESIDVLPETASGQWDAGSDPARAARCIEALMQDSNAENFHAIVDYVERGHGMINFELRGDRPISPETVSFLREFAQLSAYDGVAYRAAEVERGGREALSTVGALVMDDGVQSASVLDCNAREWLAEMGGAGLRKDLCKVLMIFDDTVPKKNLSTGFLLDHVAIPPKTMLSVSGARMHGGILVVDLAQADCGSVSHEVRDPFDARAKPASTLPAPDVRIANPVPARREWL
jgi:hypothetical protein